MSADRVRTATNVHLDTHPEATYRVRNIGRIGSNLEPTFALDFMGDGTWADVTVFMTWAQLRQLRLAIAQTVEEALREVVEATETPTYPGAVTELASERYDVSIDEAVQRG